MTCPDPEGSYVSPDGVEVPMGKTTDSGLNHSSLLYNEYPWSKFARYMDY
jgi:hypothetical protein